MKKFTALAILFTAFIFQYCHSAKKAQKAHPAVTYEANVQPIIAASCSPCHIPPGGNKLALNSYAAASKNIDSMLVRIEKNPGDKGFMPFKHPKLPDSTIQVFVNWKAGGLKEK